MDDKKQTTATPIVLGYAGFAGLWILVSDHIVSMLFSDPSLITLVSTLKGWMFVVVTSLLLYALLQRLLRKARVISQREEEARLEIGRVHRLLAQIADSSTDVIYAKDIDGRYLLFNRAASRATGKNADQVLGYDDTVLFPIAQAENSRAKDRQVIAENRIITYEDTGSTLDGNVTYLTIKGPLCNTDGSVIGVFGVSRDITERKQAELALKDGETFVQTILSSLNFMIAVIDHDGVIVSVNDSWQRFAIESGINPGMPALHTDVGTNYLEACRTGEVASDGSIDALNGIQDVLEGKKSLFRMEYQYSSPTQTRWFVMRVTPFPKERLGAVISHIDITESKQAEIALQESESRLSAIFNTSPIGINVVRASDRVIIDINETALQILGYQRNEIIGQSIDDLNLIVKQSQRNELFSQILEQGGINQVQIEWRKKNGEIICMEYYGRNIVVKGEQCILGLALDLTEKIQAQEQLRKLAMAVEQSPESIVITNLNAEIEYVNEAFVKNTGYSREEAIGQNPRILNSGETPAETFKSLWESITKGLPWDGLFHNRRKDDSEYIEHAIITPIRQADGNITHYVAVKEDVTDKKVASDMINTLAFYDPLTGLPNRRLLLDRLKHALAAGSRSKKIGALLFIDLDNFKTLNDTLGHDVGDLLLQQVAQRLTSCVREGDTVARFGGDEFVVMLEDLSNISEGATTQAEIVGEKIMAAFSQPFQLGNYFHRSTPSIGITLVSDQQQSIDDLLKQADLAMYRAKAAGRNTLIFFDPEMQTLISNRAVLEEDLREAILKSQFQLYYQPQVIGDGRLTGAEALLRWRHPQRGIVSPGEFIPLAEETGLILPIGHWVLETACVQLANWAVRPELALLTVAVNVSAIQFRQPTFVDEVLTILEQSGANPKKLKLELTESLLLNDVESVIAKMGVLKAKGIGFSLDDFGTGFSSLSYLKRLPLDQLKIDQGFVRDILTDPNDAAIAKMVVALAESMGLSVIAEGVEIEAQRDFLSRHGCHAYQGYLFSRPIPLEDFEAYVKRGMRILNDSFMI